MDANLSGIGMKMTTYLVKSKVGARSRAATAFTPAYLQSSCKKLPLLMGSYFTANLQIYALTVHSEGSVLMGTSMKDEKGPHSLNNP